MDEADEYVPQISQIDYQVMEGAAAGRPSAAAAAASYYDSGVGAPHDMYAQQASSYMGMNMHNFGSGQVGTNRGPPAAPAAPPVKGKRGGGRKKQQPVADQQQQQQAFQQQQQQQQMYQQYQMRAQQYNPYGGYPQQQPQQAGKWPEYGQMAQQQPYRCPQQQTSGYGAAPSHCAMPPQQGYYHPGMGQQPGQQAGPPPQAVSSAPPSQQQRPQFYGQQQNPYMQGAYPQQPQQQASQQPQPNRYPGMAPGQGYYPDPNGYSGYSTSYPGAQPPQSAPTQQQKPPHMIGAVPHQQIPHSSASQIPSAQAAYPQQHPKQVSGAYPGQQQQSQVPTPQSQQVQPRPLYNGHPAPQTQQPPYYGQNMMLQQQIGELERQLAYFTQQPPTPELQQRVEQYQIRINMLKQQLQSQTQPQPQQQPNQASMHNRMIPPQKSMYPNYQQPHAPVHAVEQQQPPPQPQQQQPQASIENNMPNMMGQNQKAPVHVAPPTQHQMANIPPSSASVQVNITPEATGRTLISVYHQYPSSTNTSISDSPAPSLTNASFKDSVPPEPVPSTSFHNKDTRNGANSMNVPVPEQKPETKFMQSKLVRPELSPIPPQPTPSTEISTHSETQSVQSIPEQPKTSTSPEVPAQTQEVTPRAEVPPQNPLPQSSARPPVETPIVFKQEQIEPQNEDSLQSASSSVSKPESSTYEQNLPKPEDQPPPKLYESVDCSERFIKPSARAIAEHNIHPPSVESVSVNIEQAGKKVKKPPPPPKPRKTPAVNRKRKKHPSESGSDEDHEFIVDSKKKKVKPQTNGSSSENPGEAEINMNDFVEKRRSGRTKNEKKYDEKMDYDEELDELLPSTSSIPEETPPPAANNEFVVEKILGVRLVPKESIIARPKVEPVANGEENMEVDEPSIVEKEENMDGENVDEAKETNGKVDQGQGTSTSKEKEETPSDEKSESDTEVEEIYVKYKNKSYLHCEWKTMKELEQMDKRILAKVNRFKMKNVDWEDMEYFNEDYTVVDRVLDVVNDQETNEHVALIKWKSLAYEEATWEDISVVPEQKLEEYHARNDKIDPNKAKETARPDAESFHKTAGQREYKDGNTLREYQIEGVNWLLFCYYNRQNCILADEMGLGKTVQTITFLQGIHDLGIHGPFLVVVPLSTLHNWEREFETWTNMNTVVYHGGAASREFIQQYELCYDRSDSKVPKFDALLTTFEMVVSDVEILRKFSYRVCVIDEAHRLKNRNSKLLTGGLLSFKLEHRVLLTGTPLQNNIQELFSLLNFLEPEQFHSSDDFLTQFGQCQTEEQVQKLQEILKPMMLRRLKEDVEKTLQPKEETIIEVQLSNIQKKYYRAILERNFTHLLKGTSVPSLMNTMMELRKCCNHPFLIKGAEDQILTELRQAHPDRAEEELAEMAVVQSSGKVVLIHKLLPKLKQDGHKVLIFSQMVRVLDILEEFLVHMNYSFERIDGNVRGDLRQAAIDRFSRPDSDRFIFLLCTRAGGLGINLTAADTVIIFDSDWNPQNDLQAQARCHRIGQTKMVKVYRLITANTYEREMFDKASLKLGLDKAVLQSMTPKDSTQQLTRKEVEDLLKKGAYGAVMDEDNEGSKFSEEDIETILSRRTQTIRLEPGVKGSTFAKASFTSSNNREDIDVNDPNFWSKWAKKANVDVDAGSNELILTGQRNRRKRFEENYKGLHEGESDAEEGSEGGRSADFSKSRSGKKRRRGDDDDDYVNYTPDELAFNKSEYFKVEKMLNTWGWGRWKEMKEHAEMNLSEKDIEHISRTFLLHCIREFRGDEKTRDFVWHLIAPEGQGNAKGDKKQANQGPYNEGWALLPEYNPPAFALDQSLNRHIHRHASKLLQRMFHFFLLHNHLIGKEEAEAIMAGKDASDVKIAIPAVGDAPLANWDLDCDKSFIIGIYKHGMENFEAMRTDPKLCFQGKGMEEMPTTLELNTRFKRIMALVARQLEMTLNAVQAAAAGSSHSQNRWPKQEETEFMKILRVYGVKDDNDGHNVINWNRFRELSVHLQKKSDAEMLEQLYCVLAMCTKEQGGELSTVDQRRAAQVDPIPPKKAEKLMNRLHLMRKIHAIVTTGLQKVRTSLKLCSAETMYPGWGELQDEQLLIVVDKHGLDNIVTKISRINCFEKFVGVMDEVSMVRRVVEICTTLETGKWNGKGTVDLIDDDDTLTSSDAQALAMIQRMLNQSKTPNLAQQQRRSKGKRPGMPATPNSAAQSMNDLSYMMQMFNTLMPLSSGTSTQQQQQMQQMALLAMMSQMTDPNSMKLLMQAMTPEAMNLTTSSSHKPSTSKQANSSASVASSNPTPAHVKKEAPSTSAAVSTNAAVPSTSGSTGTTAQGGPSMSDVLKMLNIPKNTPIPVVDSETGESITGASAPLLSNLDSWLAAHPKYRVDIDTIMKTPGDAKTTAKTERPASSTPRPKEDPAIGVFNRNTGVVVAKEKWPKVSELASFLDKHTDHDVQEQFTAQLKSNLPSSYHSRVGNDRNATAAAALTAAATAAAATSSSSTLTAAEQAVLQTMALSAASAPSSFDSLQNAMLMQQLLLGPQLSGSASAYTSNPYLQLMAAQPNLNISQQDAALLAAMFNMTPATLPSTSQQTQQKAPSLSTATPSIPAQPTAQQMNELITQELLSNPALLATLMGQQAGPSSGTSNNQNSTASAASLGGLGGLGGLSAMDMSAALQLQLLLAGAAQQPPPAKKPVTTAQSATTTTPTTSASTSAASSVPSASTASRAGKLNALVEKLASSSQSNSNQNGER